MLKRLALLVSMLVFGACESGTSVVVVIDLAGAVISDTSPESPSVLVADIDDGLVRPVVGVCGESFEEPIRLSVDFGFGCLGDREGSEIQLRAWAEPMPASWNAQALCAAELSFRGLALGPDIVGERTDGGPTIEELADNPEPDWPSGSGTATFRRDLSPCGGTATGEVRVE